MKIFIFEDNQDRIETFKKVLPKNYNLVICDNIEIAKAILLDNLAKFDVAFLDHDMDQKSFVPSNDPNTGYQVAKFIVENGIYFKQVFVHSMNPSGAENIMNELNRSVTIREIHRTPFPT